MPRIRPLSPDGQVMISDIGAHLLEMGLPGRQSARRQGWGQGWRWRAMPSARKDHVRAIAENPQGEIVLHCHRLLSVIKWWSLRSPRWMTPHGDRGQERTVDEDR